MPRSKQISFIVKISACLILFFIPISPATVFSADVTLTWCRPNDSRVTGYEIFYGPYENDDLKSSPKETIHSPDQTSCDIYGLISGQTYAFTAKSFDKYDNESTFSEVIFYDVPNAPNDNSNNNSDDDKDKNSYGNGPIDTSGEKNDTDIDQKVNKSSGGSSGGCYVKTISNLMP